MLDRLVVSRRMALGGGVPGAPRCPVDANPAGILVHLTTGLSSLGLHGTAARGCVGGGKESCFPHEGTRVRTLSPPVGARRRRRRRYMIIKKAGLNKSGCPEDRGRFEERAAGP